MNRFKILAHKTENANYKKIFRIIGDGSPDSVDGTKDASSVGRFTPSSIKDIKDTLWEEVRNGEVMDGPTRSFDEVTKGLTVSMETLKKNLRVDPGKAFDGFFNEVTGIGTGIDPGSWNNAYTPVSLSPQEATAFYSSGGIAETIIDKKSKGILV